MSYPFLPAGGTPPAGRKGYDIGQITKMREQGFTQAEIAARIGCSTHTVYRVMKRHGIQ
jgi:DNA invertase Pin-like site-specific DNA recombinase